MLKYPDFLLETRIILLVNAVSDRKFIVPCLSAYEGSSNVQASRKDKAGLITEIRIQQDKTMKQQQPPAS